MRKLIVEEWISLDGYVNDKEGSLNFFAGHVRESYCGERRTAFLDAIDTILLGRKTYCQFESVWPVRPIEQDALAKKMNTGKKIVFSNTLSDAPWGQWKEVEIDKGRVADRVVELKSSPGKNIVVWGSITIAHQLIKEGLVDEYHLHICPVITAGGRRFFTEDLQPHSLTLIDIKNYGPAIAYLHYKQTWAVK
jgi:dihydrofolate reductase